MVTISVIKDDYKRMVPGDPESFINTYIDDERKSVQDLINKAKKAITEREKELERVQKMYDFDKSVSGSGLVCGVDEVGRGPFAGPVVTAAVILDNSFVIPYINDSKQVSKAKREELYDIITEKCIAYSIGINDEKVIDEINILEATKDAMSKAVNSLSVKPDCVIVDAVTIPNIDVTQKPFVKGDERSACVAAASIVAKVTRDRMMEKYAKLYPEYGFEKNAGYGSAAHRDALKKYGPCPIHRRTFIKNWV